MASALRKQPSYSEADALKTKMEAFRHSLQITDRILSDRPNVRLKFESVALEEDPEGHRADSPGWLAYSYGEEIFVNVDKVSNPDSASGVAVILGMNYHELAHVMLTPPDRAAIRRAYRPDPGWLRNTLHKDWDRAYGILEDHRIETLLGAKYASMNKYFSYAVLSQIVEKTAPDQVNVRHLLTHGRHHLPAEVRSTFKDFFEKKFGESAAADFEKIIDEYRFIPYASHADECAGALLVQKFAILLENHKITPPPSDHNPEGQSPQGGRPAQQNKEVEENQRRQMSAAAKKQEDEEERQQDPEGDSDDDSDAQESDTADDGGEDEDDDHQEDDGEEGEGGESDDDDGTDPGDPESGDEADGDDPEAESAGEEESDTADDGGEDEDDEDSGGGVDREGGGEDGEDDSGEVPGSGDGSGEGDEDATGQDGDDPDGDGAGSASVGSAGGTGELIDTSDVISTIVGIMESALDDRETAAEIRRYQTAMTNSEGLSSVLDRAPEKNSGSKRPVTPEMFGRSEQVGVVFREIWARMEPGWEYGVSDGHRLNMANAMMASKPEDYDSIYDDWSAGQQDNSGVEAVIIGDRSYSTNSIYHPPNWDFMTPSEQRRQPSLANVFSRNIWELMHALQEVGARVTVLAFDHNCFTFYSRDEQVDGTGWYLLRSEGGTMPLSAIQEARRILLQSDQPNKIFLAFTDGEWGEEEHGSIDAALASMEGIVKVAALVGDYTAELFEYTRSFDVVENTAGDILHVMSAAVARMLERSADGR